MICACIEDKKTGAVVKACGEHEAWRRARLEAAALLAACPVCLQAQKEQRASARSN